MTVFRGLNFLLSLIRRLDESTGLRIKILGITLGTLLLVGGSVILHSRAVLEESLLEQLDRVAISLGRDVASRSVDLLLTSNTFALHELLTSIKENNPDVRYLFVLDQSGNVITHTFGPGFPVDLLKVNRSLPGEEYSLRILATDEGFVHDVAVPILKGQLGYVRLGLTEKRIAATIWAATGKESLFILLVSLLGVFGAYYLVLVLVRPINQLVSVTSSVAHGDFSRKVTIKSQDEIGALAASFNTMVDSLRLYRTELDNLSRMRAQLVEKVISAQEEERRRIARELHDETGQALTSIMLVMKALEGADSLAEVREGLAELRSITSAALRDIRRLAVELRPSALDDLGLLPAISRYSQEYSAKFGLEVRIDKDEEALGRLPQAMEVSLFRIVQEALTNVVKHAQATSVSLAIQKKDDHLAITIEDNGRGFDLERLEKEGNEERRLGLFGMQERASLLGGTLSISSFPGRGTRVAVQVPLTG